MADLARKLIVCFSVDVEEEGLFKGCYQTGNLSVANVGHLENLGRLAARFQLPLTLFCSWAIFQDSTALEAILRLHSRLGAEIGAHLHHWNTPPLQAGVASVNPAANAVPAEVLAAKLECLLSRARARTGLPVSSFRMGRWDLRRRMLPLLAANGITVDSSICPLRHFHAGPDHFLAPASPYWVPLGEEARILEVPITQTPLNRLLASLWHRFFAQKPGLLDSFHFFGACSANPVWHCLPVMKFTALRNAYGCGILNFFLHSSELMPGASPNVPNQRAVDALLAKIASFLTWLCQSFAITGVTTSQFANLPQASTYPVLETPAEGDW